jgi:hypothetical protein
MRLHDNTPRNREKLADQFKHCISVFAASDGFVSRDHKHSRGHLWTRHLPKVGESLPSMLEREGDCVTITTHEYMVNAAKQISSAIPAVVNSKENALERVSEPMG